MKVDHWEHPDFIYQLPTDEEVDKFLLENGYDKSNIRVYELLNKIYRKIITTKYLRTVLSEAQNHRCCYCGNKLKLKSKYKSEIPTIEHVIPKSQGGQLDYENCVIACQKCNNDRGDQPYEDFLKRMERKNVKRIQHQCSP